MGPAQLGQCLGVAPHLPEKARKAVLLGSDISDARAEPLSSSQHTNRNHPGKIQKLLRRVRAFVCRTGLGRDFQCVVHTTSNSRIEDRRKRAIRWT